MSNTRSSSQPPAALAAATVLALTLTACGGDASPEEGGDVELRFAFWGTADRADRFQEAIDIFEDENPGIDVRPEVNDWDGYWDRLATVVAGGDIPDIMMQEDRYIGEYASRGVLADLSGSVPTDDVDAHLLSSGEIDGAQYGYPTGSNVFSVVANPDMFEDAGVPMPDDSTWTWEEYVDVSNALSDGLDGQAFGTSDYSFAEVGFRVYARQHGQALFTEDGTLGYEDELLEEWFQRSLDLQESGGQPSADQGLALDLLDSPIATGEAAMSLTWSAQLEVLSEATGTHLTLLRIPGESEFDQAGMYFKPGMYLAAAETSDHQAEAAQFIDFMINDTRVGEIFLSELGLPGNANVREAVVAELDTVDQVAADFVTDLSDEIVDAAAVMPQGASAAAEIMQRVNSEVLFEQITPEEGAAKFRSELEAALS
ncbi:ABC transporter substrate-binding protein [Nesterenkonia xinjiangensis]|uniref:Multiple sugar transport system substrate-binding protein n=1 Tax=Nesterenkonia xinjiangensis TaxID=225327 RepID=A0A7Z0GNA3_9MICC|nr:extracellular solute-binding protein [Nesterenkonia xinjiangensis]NYJ78241.1 multiple sugar transport system substrate-binding protein [Nesterenkonia xinjiangensis]